MNKQTVHQARQIEETGMTYRILTPTACCGVEVIDGRIVSAAPYIAGEYRLACGISIIGASWPWVRQWMRRKHWTIEEGR